MLHWKSVCLERFYPTLDGLASFLQKLILGDTSYHIETQKNPTVQSLFVPSKHTIFVYCTAVVSCMPLHPTVGVRRRSPSEPHNACVLQSSDSGHAGAADWNSRSEEFARQISFLHESLGLSEEASRSWSRYSSQVPDSTDPNVRLRVEGELKEWSDAARALTRRKPGAIEMPELRHWAQVQKWPQWRAVQKRCQSCARRAKICC